MTDDGGAIERIAAAAANPVDVPDLRGAGQDGDPANDGGDAYDVVDLGATCPVQPLGFHGQRNYFLDFAYQLIELGTEMRKGECMQLFGTKLRWLEKRWPTGRMVKDKSTGIEEFMITGFDQKEAQKGLIMACAKAGLFDPTGKVRGRGAHIGDEGALYLHCGNGVLVGGRKGLRGKRLATTWAKCGLVGGYVYPAAEALDRPADVAAPTHVGEQILELLQTWNWKRGAIEPYLLLGWMAAACLGGALKWRPHAWITGPSGAGKSSLQKLLAELMAGWAIRTEDATEAGVRQLLHQDTLAVCFDEIEPDEGDGAVHHKIVKLARLASSGGSALRGSQDHKSKQFVAKSCFLFSSIHHHELAAQDRNRIAILHLSAFAAGTPPLILPETLALWGAQLRRRLMEQWPRFEATLLAYQKAMNDQKWTGREQDQYGTLLACADLLLHDDVPPEAMQAALNHEPDRLASLVPALAVILEASRAEGESSTARCLNWLSSRRLPAASGAAPETVGEWIVKAAIEGLVGDVKGEAQRRLMSHGMKLISLSDKHAEGGGQGGLDSPLGRSVTSYYVVVANKAHQGVLEIFNNSQWHGGVWTQALILVDGAIQNKKARFGGAGSFGAVIVPLEQMIDVDAVITQVRQLQLAGV